MKEFHTWLSIVAVTLTYMLVSALWVGVGTLERIAHGLELVEQTYIAVEQAEQRSIERDQRLDARIRWFILRRSGANELDALEGALE